MVFQCSKLFYYKVSDEFLRQDSQSSYSFGKIQNVGETELFEEKEFSVSLEKDSIIRFHIYINLSHNDELREGENTCLWMYIYIYIYMYLNKS